MRKLLKNTILTLFNPISPVVTLLIGWLLTIIVSQPNENFPEFINLMIEYPLFLISFIVLWLIFAVIYTELQNRINTLRTEIEIKDVQIKEKQAQLDQTSGIVLNRSGDFANFNKSLRFNDALKGFVENNTLVESAQIYKYTIKRINKVVQIKVVYDSGYVYENVDINNLAQTYYEIDYDDYNRLKDMIKTWKELSVNIPDSYRREDTLISYTAQEITDLFKKYYNDLISIPDISEIENRHFMEYRVITLLLRLARRSSTTTFDKKNILGDNKQEIENYLLNGKRTGILNSILIEDTFMFKYTRNSHKKDGRAYVCFHAQIANQNYIISFSIQTNELDPYLNLEQEITHLKQDFIKRLAKK